MAAIEMRPVRPRTQRSQHRGPFVTRFGSPNREEGLCARWYSQHGYARNRACQGRQKRFLVVCMHACVLASMLAPRQQARRRRMASIVEEWAEASQQFHVLPLPGSTTSDSTIQSLKFHIILQKPASDYPVSHPPLPLSLSSLTVLCHILISKNSLPPPCQSQDFSLPNRTIASTVIRACSTVARLDPALPDAQTSSWTSGFAKLSISEPGALRNQKTTLR